MTISTEPMRDVLFSILAFCKKFSVDNPGSDLQVEDFDAHADINEFEEKNYVGVMEYEIEDQGGPLEIMCMIGIMMFRDTHIQGLRKLISQLFMKLRPGTRIPLVVGDTGSLIGNLIVMDGVRALPISREMKNRPIQMIAVRFASDLATVPR